MPDIDGHHPTCSRRESPTRATYAEGYEDVWIVCCTCGHQWIYDRGDLGRKTPWGCSWCGEAPPETATLEGET